MPATQKPGVGALLQSNLIGPQEERFYDNTSTNQFTDQKWKRPTRGAVEQNELSFPFVLGSLNKKVIPRRGDMLGNLALSITLPVVPGAGIDDYWLPSVGLILLRKLSLTLNDVELDSSERLWLSIQDDLFLPDGKRDGVRDMIGRSGLRLTQSHTIVVPLKFFNCYRHGQPQNFMPLLSTTNENTLLLQIETEKFENCVTSYAGILPPSDLECSLITDYVFLDKEEKERLVNSPYPMLAEVVQDVENVSYREVLDSTLGDTKIPQKNIMIDLSEINYPTRYLVFTAYKIDSIANKKYFQYEDIIEKASLLFDGEERTEHQDADHYSLLQTYQHARRCLQDRIYMYSFALDCTTAQPNGHFTFSNIRKGTLKITLKEPRDDIILKCFVVGYRYIDFINGGARVRFL